MMMGVVVELGVGMMDDGMGDGAPPDGGEALISSLIWISYDVLVRWVGMIA
jgi:hypothetical protein